MIKTREKQLLGTVTGELYQPIRLHYKLFDQKRIIKIFRKIRCLDFDPSQNRWVWLYDFEAKKLTFEKSYSSIPRHLHPIVIGSFFIRAENLLLLDLRSFERATKAIVFFDKFIPRSVAKVTHAEIVNRLFDSTEKDSTPTNIFDNNISEEIDPDAYVKSLMDMTSKITNIEKKREIVTSHITESMKKPLHEMEKFPTNYYEDGIQSLETALTIRQTIALKHWYGDKNFTFFDLMLNSNLQMDI